jgi:hypothetical protein
MIGQEFICARQECGAVGIKTTHNQKYCTNECCRIETNRKIKEQYHERAAIKRGKKRACKSCGTPLSRYNESPVCSACQTAKRNENLGEAQQLLAAVAWL